MRGSWILFPAVLLGAALSSTAQQPMPRQYETWERYWPSLYPVMIGMLGQVCDFNGDGIPDLVISLSSSATLPVGLGLGNGEFAWNWVPLPPASFPAAVAAGRLRPGAGPEIILGCGAGPNGLQPAVLLSMDASGTFQVDTTGRLPQIPSDPLALLLVDVNKDGSKDLLVFGSYGQPTMLWLNDGTGRFQDATSTNLPATGWSTMGAVEVDVNGDGWPDIACANGGYVGLERSLILLNDGTGRFQVQWLPGGPAQHSCIATADFDGDGWPDLYVGQVSASNPQKLYMNQGGNGFVDSTNLLPPVSGGAVTSVLVMDVDGDGRPDLVVGGNFAMGPPRIFLNRLPQGFVDKTTELVPGVYGVGGRLLLAGDFDLDGGEDILAERAALLPPPPDRRWPIFFNLRRHLYTQDQVKVGGPFSVQCWADPLHVAMPLLSFAPARLPVPGFGILGLDPVRAVMLPTLLIPQSRKATLTLQVPSDPSLRGHAIYTQALDLDPLNFARSHLTNWVKDVVQ